MSPVRFGPRVYEAINDSIEEADIDLVAMGSGDDGEFGGLLGSTADKLLRTVRVPVLVLRREPREAESSGPKPSAAAR